MTSKADKKSKKMLRSIDPILNRYRFDKSTEMFKCLECNYSTENRTYVRQHMVSHSTCRPFVCDYENCDQNYKRKNELKRHIQIFHWGLKPHVCPNTDCNKAFTQSQSLKDHIQSVHSNHKRFKCGFDNCLKRFALERNMRSHQMRRHLKNGFKPMIGKHSNKRNDCFDGNRNERQNTSSESDVSVTDAESPTSSQECGRITRSMNASKSHSLDPKYDFNELKTKDGKKKKTSETNGYLFECNFFECFYNTYTFEEIAQHFEEHWKEMNPF